MQELRASIEQIARGAEVSEGDLEGCLRSYEEVVSAEVRHSLDFGAPSWERFWRRVEEHCHEGRKVG